MKKKILLSIALASVLALMLAISISAASTNAFGTVETSDKIDLTGMATDTDLRVVLFDGTEYHTYPSQYIVTSNTELTLNFEQINEAFEKSYTNKDVIRFEVPRHVIKISAKYFGSGVKDEKLVEVFFPVDASLEEMAWGAFENTPNLEKINIPKSFKKFANQNHFASCPKLTEFTFDEGCTFTEIPVNFLTSCKSLETIVFPNSVTSIGGGAFASCTKLKTIVLGANVQTMNGPMSDCATGGSTWYLPETFYSSSVTSEPSSNMFHWAGNKNDGSSGTGNNPRNITFVYTGTKAQAEALQARFKAADLATGENCVGLSRLYNAILCTEAEYKELTGKNVGEGASGYYLVYGYGKCDAFYNGECAPSESKNQFDGEKYLSSYCQFSTCPRCGEGSKVELCAPLFVNKGYSRELNGTYFDYGFTVDKEEIAKYEALTGNTVSYGVVAANKTVSENGALFDESGKAVDGVISMSFNGTSYNVYNVKITGIGSGDVKKQLYCSAYVTEAGKTVYIGEAVTEIAILISFDQIKVASTEE